MGTRIEERGAVPRRTPDDAAGDELGLLAKALRAVQAAHACRTERPAADATFMVEHAGHIIARGTVTVGDGHLTSGDAFVAPKPDTTAGGNRTGSRPPSSCEGSRRRARRPPAPGAATSGARRSGHPDVTRTNGWFLRPPRLEHPGGRQIDSGSASDDAA